jgi:hypothetical protein
MRAPRPASRRDHSPRLIQPGSDKRLPRTRTCARASVNRTPVGCRGRSLLRCRRPRGRRCRRRRCPCIHGTQFYRRERLRTGTAAGSSGDSSSSTLDENFGSADEEDPPIALPTFAKGFPIETAFPTYPGTGLEPGPLFLTMAGDTGRTPAGASESWATAARQRRLFGRRPQQRRRPKPTDLDPDSRECHKEVHAATRAAGLGHRGWVDWLRRHTAPPESRDCSEC